MRSIQPEVDLDRNHHRAPACLPSFMAGLNLYFRTASASLLVQPHAQGAHHARVLRISLRIHESAEIQADALVLGPPRFVRELRLQRCSAGPGAETPPPTWYSPPPVSPPPGPYPLPRPSPVRRPIRFHAASRSLSRSRASFTFGRVLTPNSAGSGCRATDVGLHIDRRVASFGLSRPHCGGVSEFFSSLGSLPLIGSIMCGRRRHRRRPLGSPSLGALNSSPTSMGRHFFRLGDLIMIFLPTKKSSTARESRYSRGRDADRPRIRLHRHPVRHRNRRRGQFQRGKLDAEKRRRECSRRDPAQMGFSSNALPRKRRIRARP
jgi:hypothetical protein